MAQERCVTLTLPDDLLLALGRAARDARVRPGDYVRAALELALERGGFGLPGPAERLRIAFGLATGWPDLQRRLRADGRVLRASAGGELFLHSWPDDRQLVPLSALGHSRAHLALQFGTDFPPSPAPRPEWARKARPGHSQAA